MHKTKSVFADVTLYALSQVEQSFVAITSPLPYKQTLLHTYILTAITEHLLSAISLLGEIFPFFFNFTRFSSFFLLDRQCSNVTILCMLCFLGYVLGQAYTVMWRRFRVAPWQSV